MSSAMILAGLTVVFVASMLNQLPIGVWQRLVARIDPWTFLPHWGFFGPNPAFAGIHLIYRDRTPQGWSEWRELDIPSSSGWSWFWNPARHERKALHDLLNGLARSAAELGSDRKVMLSGCHLALATWVMSQDAGDADARCRQFALVEAVGHGSGRRLRPVFISKELSFG